MGLALVIFIAAYLKMSTPEITTRHTVLYSPPLYHVELLHTERNRAYKVPIFRVFWNFHDRYVRTYAVSLRLTADEIQ